MRCWGLYALARVYPPLFVEVGDGGGDAFEIGEGQCLFDIGLREGFELGLGDHGVPAE